MCVPGAEGGWRAELTWGPAWGHTGRWTWMLDRPYSAVTFTLAVETGHRVLVCRAGLSQSEALPRPCLLPTRCRRWPQSSSRHAGLAPHGPVGSSRLARAAVPGCSARRGCGSRCWGHGTAPVRPAASQAPFPAAAQRAGSGLCWWLRALGLARREDPYFSGVLSPAGSSLRSPPIPWASPPSVPDRRALWAAQS